MAPALPLRSLKNAKIECCKLNVPHPPHIIQSQTNWLSNADCEAWLKKARLIVTCSVTVSTVDYMPAGISNTISLWIKIRCVAE